MTSEYAICLFANHLCCLLTYYLGFIYSTKTLAKNNLFWYFFFVRRCYLFFFLRFLLVMILLWTESIKICFGSSIKYHSISSMLIQNVSLFTNQQDLPAQSMKTYLILPDKTQNDKQPQHNLEQNFFPFALFLLLQQDITRYNVNVISLVHISLIVCIMFYNWIDRLYESTSYEFLIVPNDTNPPFTSTHTHWFSDERLYWTVADFRFTLSVWFHSLFRVQDVINKVRR